MTIDLLIFSLVIFSCISCSIFIVRKCGVSKMLNIMEEMEWTIKCTKLCMCKNHSGSNALLKSTDIYQGKNIFIYSLQKYGFIVFISASVRKGQE